MAMAAIIASYALAAVFRPRRRSDAATPPNARAASASKGSGSIVRLRSLEPGLAAARSSSDATSGPTLSSANVIVVINGRVRQLRGLPEPFEDDECARVEEPSRQDASQRWIDHAVDVSPEGLGVHRRESPPALQDHLDRELRAGKRDQARDREAIPCDGQHLARDRPAR